MVFPQSLEDFAAGCEEVFGRKPIYVSLPKPGEETDLPMEAWCLALLADGYEWITELTGFGGGDGILQQIEGTGFDFERKVCDQYVAGSTTRHLRVFHGVSQERILDILNRHEPEGGWKRKIRPRDR